ncbi:hypothetical protein [Streptomyces sp900116325]|uniref:hypothetical protein n=1 Tax=Streptomyces sp. 900116325 TaxID=3154295 RepID=UPI0033FCDD0E
MCSFYVFEGSFFQGGGGWEEIEVRTDLLALQQITLDYIRSGIWADVAGDELSIRTYQAGRLVQEVDIYPFLHIKIPGLTTVSFLDGGEPQGGIPEPGSSYEVDWNLYEEEDDESWIAQFLVNEFEEIASERPDDIEITINWTRLALPELEQPVLPDSGDVFVRQGVQGQWGNVVADDDSQAGDGRILTCGRNSVFM